MSSEPFLDQLPSREQRKLKKMMSAGAYEKLREKVKGPEDLERELKKSEALADVRFGLETEPPLQRTAKEQAERSIREQGIDNVLEIDQASPEARRAVEQGKFVITVSSHPATHEDGLAVAPDGNVQEKIPVKQSYAEDWIAQIRSTKP